MNTYIVSRSCWDHETSEWGEIQLEIEADTPYVTDSGALIFNVGTPPHTCVRGFNGHEWDRFWLVAE